MRQTIHQAEKVNIHNQLESGRDHSITSALSEIYRTVLEASESSLRSLLSQGRHTQTERARSVGSRYTRSLCPGRREKARNLYRLTVVLIN